MPKLDKSVISLTPGIWAKITSDVPVTWESDNPNIIVDNDGWCLALVDKIGVQGKANIKATSNGDVAVCKATVVPWKANGMNLKFIKNYGRYYVTKDEDRFLAILETWPSMKTELYETKDFETFNLLMKLPNPAESVPIFKTPHGYFIKCEDGIYHSDDLKSVTKVQETAITARLYHSFSVYYDKSTRTSYIYCGEYSVGTTPENNPNRHKIYRGIVTDTSQEWGVALDLASQMERLNNPEGTPLSVRHFHAVQVDPYTGDVYCATGDYPWECYIFRSQDHGETWHTLNKTYPDNDWANSQPWRALSIWFTEKYVYWNNDTATPPQCIWRLARSNFGAHSHGNDLKELAVKLDDGAHWFTAWMKDLKGRDTVFIGASVEGQVRDLNSRVYSITEKPDGGMETNEIYLNNGGDIYNMMLQLEPKFQDKDGYYYLNHVSAEPRGIWKMKLVPEEQKRRVWKRVVFK